MFMAGKITFRRPASPDPELRLFSVKPVPAVPPTPLPNTSSSPAPSSITSHRPSLSTSNSTSSSKRRRSPSPPTNRRDESVSQPSSSRGRSRERALHEPHHHSPSPPPILPDLQSTRKPHDRPTHSVGPFDEGKDTVLYTQSDPLRGHFVRTQVHGTRQELTIRCLAGTGADPIHFHRHLDQIATCNPLANLSSQHAENMMRSCESISTTGLEIHSFMNLHLIFFSSGHD